MRYCASYSVPGPIRPDAFRSTIRTIVRGPSAKPPVALSGSRTSTAASRNACNPSRKVAPTPSPIRSASTRSITAPGTPSTGVSACASGMAGSSTTAPTSG